MEIGWSNFGIQLDLNALMEVNLDTHGDPGSEMLDTWKNLQRSGACHAWHAWRVTPDSGHKWLMNFDFWHTLSREKRKRIPLPAVLEAFAKYNPKRWDSPETDYFLVAFMNFCFVRDAHFIASVELQLVPVEPRHGCISILNGLPRQCSATSNPRLRGILSEICTGKEDRRRTVMLDRNIKELAAKKNRYHQIPTSSHILTHPHTSSCHFLYVQCSIVRSFWTSPDRHRFEIWAILCREGRRCARKKHGPRSNSHQYEAPEIHRAWDWNVDFGQWSGRSSHHSPFCILAETPISSFNLERKEANRMKL